MSVITPLRQEDAFGDRAGSLAALVNDGAEQALLGAILCENRAYAGAAAIVSADDFGNAVHGRIFAAIGALIERGQTANPITLKNLFDQDTALFEIGGAQYLARLASSAVTIINAVDYGRTVADLAQRRRLRADLEDALREVMAHAIDRPLSKIVGDHASRLATLGAAAAPPELASLDPATLLDLPVPSRQWLVPDWIPLARATSLYGAGGEGKTLLAQMLATACAIGKPWLGLAVRRCNSLLYFCEDDVDEMHRRQEDINQHYGCSFADLSAMRWLPRLGDDNALMTFDNGLAQHTDLFRELLAAAKAHDAGLVITDTLADIFPGNENDRGQARQFAQGALGLLGRETGGAILTLAHPSLAGSSNGSTGSGSTGWKGTFRSQLYLESPTAEEGEPPDPDTRLLRRAKANFARRDETIEIRWKDGVFIPLHVPTGILGSIERRTCERVFLKLLVAVTEEGQPVSANTRAGNYAPRLFGQRTKGEREGFRTPDFIRAMQALFAQRPPLISNAEYGKKSDPRYRIVKAADDPQGTSE